MFIFYYLIADHRDLHSFPTRRSSDLIMWARLPLRIRLTLAFCAAMAVVLAALGAFVYVRDRKSTRLNSSHSSISYAVFCLKKKKKKKLVSMYDKLDDM